MGVDRVQESGVQPEGEVPEDERTALLIRPSQSQITFNPSDSNKQDVTSIADDDDLEGSSINSEADNLLTRISTPKTVTKSAAGIILVLLIGLYFDHLQT